MTARGGGEQPLCSPAVCGTADHPPGPQALPTVVPGRAHDAPLVEVEHVEHDQRHRAAPALPVGEHGAASLRLFRLVTEVLHAIERQDGLHVAVPFRLPELKDHRHHRVHRLPRRRAPIATPSTGSETGSLALPARVGLTMAHAA